MRIVGAEERLLGQDFRAAGDGPSLPGKLNADQWARYTYGGVFQRTDLSANPPIRKSIDGQRLEIRHSHSEKPVVVLRKEWGVHPEVEQMRAGAAVEDRANG